jgi:hypothetical protein
MAMKQGVLLCVTTLLAASLPSWAGSLAPLHSRCYISADEDSGRLRLHIPSDDCGEARDCGSNFSSDSLDRLTGITRPDLAREGATLTATLAAEAGTFTCTGTVHDGELAGRSVFTPDQGFVDHMGRMGFSGYDSEKLMAYAFMDVSSGWVQSMQKAGVQGMTVDNLLALRIFKIDPNYIHSITSMGYEMPDADKLIALKVQGVNAEEVRQIRALGYQPTLDELIQIRIFKITPEFIRRMQDRGLKNLTIGKLVQIRIFKLDE